MHRSFLLIFLFVLTFAFYLSAIHLLQLRFHHVNAVASFPTHFAVFQFQHPVTSLESHGIRPVFPPITQAVV